MLDSDGSVWIASLNTSQPIYRYDGVVWLPVELPTDYPDTKELDVSKSHRCCVVGMVRCGWA